MPVVQLYIFLAQWRLVLSESAVITVSPINVSSCYHLLLSLLPWQWFSFTLTLYHKIHELFYLWCQTNLKLQENCAINAQAANHLKTAVIVTFLVRSLALHRTAEPQEALWHLTLQQGEGHGTRNESQSSIFPKCVRTFTEVFWSLSEMHPKYSLLFTTHWGGRRGRREGDREGALSKGVSLG